MTSGGRYSIVAVPGSSSERSANSPAPSSARSSLAGSSLAGSSLAESSLDALSGFEPPELAPGFAESLLRDVWGLSGTIEPLVGERTTNIRLRSADGSDHVLQVQAATGGPSDDVFDMQTRALAHAGASAETDLPEGVRIANLLLVDDEPWIRVDEGTRPLLARVLTYLDGVTFEDSNELELDAYERIGEVVGGLATALSDFEHPVAAHPMPWDIANGVIVDDTMWNLLDADALDRVGFVRPRMERLASVIEVLQRQTIHNDAHAGNLLRDDDRSNRVTGVIDFGDVVDTIRVADVAIAVESFAPRHHDPLAVTAALTTGYRRRAPLTDVEIDHVGELVLARLTLTVLLFGRHIQMVPRFADRARSAMPGLCDRMIRWAELDPAAITGAIYDGLAADATDHTAARDRRHES